MDYSLLVGVHNIDMASKEREEALADESSLPESDQEPRSRALNEKSRDRLVAHSTAMESIQVFYSLERNNASDLMSLCNRQQVIL